MLKNSEDRGLRELGDRNVAIILSLRAISATWSM
jgi:hypothetical protein